MDRDKVSIIVPIYNAERYMSICIDSILGQSYSNLEVVLVNDGSTDKSLSIMNDYAEKDSRVKIVNQVNQGVSTARNNGIEKCSGDWVCFSDADDILEPDYIEYLLRLAKTHNTDIALTTKMFSTFGGNQIRKDNIRVVTGEQVVIDILYYHIPIGVYCKIFKRSFLSNDIRFYPDVYIGEGFNFNVKALLKADRVTIGNRKIYCYRRDNSQSAMTKFSIDKCKMALKAIEIIGENLTIKSNKLLEACRFAYWHTSGDMYNWMILAKVGKKYPNMYHQCYGTLRSYSHRAIFAPLNKKERFRALVQFIHPRILAAMLEFRRWKLNRNKK